MRGPSSDSPWPWRRGSPQPWVEGTAVCGRSPSRPMTVGTSTTRWLVHACDCSRSRPDARRVKAFSSVPHPWFTGRSQVGRHVSGRRSPRERCVAIAAGPGRPGVAGRRVDWSACVRRPVPPEPAGRAGCRRAGWSHPGFGRRPGAVTRGVHVSSGLPRGRRPRAAAVKRNSTTQRDATATPPPPPVLASGRHCTGLRPHEP